MLMLTVDPPTLSKLPRAWKPSAARITLLPTQTTWWSDPFRCPHSRTHVFVDALCIAQNTATPEHSSAGQPMPLKAPAVGCPNANSRCKVPYCLSGYLVNRTVHMETCYRANQQNRRGTKAPPLLRSSWHALHNCRLQYCSA